MRTNDALLLRADAGPGIGSGHTSRLLTLASAWNAAAGGQIKLITSRPSPALLAQAKTAKIDVVDLPTVYPDSQDLAATREVAAKLGSHPWIAVDGYSFKADYMQALRDAGLRVLRVDDHPKGLIPCDVFLDQSPGVETSQVNLPPGSRALLGPRWALLRPQFAAVGARRKIAERPTKILVSYGGWDPVDATGLALRALSFLKTSFEAVVVLGPDNPRATALETFAAQMPVRVERGADMPVLMEWADVALLGGGVTAMEACAAGLPALVCTVAENQEDGARIMHERGLLRNLGRAQDLPAERLVSELNSLLSDSAVRRAFSEAGRAAVDGLGARRTVEALL